MSRSRMETEDVVVSEYGLKNCTAPLAPDVRNEVRGMRKSGQEQGRREGRKESELERKETYQEE